MKKNIIIENKLRKLFRTLVQWTRIVLNLGFV
jgi:hypothetical protein